VPREGTQVAKTESLDTEATEGRCPFGYLVPVRIVDLAEETGGILDADLRPEVRLIGTEDLVGGEEEIDSKDPLAGEDSIFLGVERQIHD
jgi:hypothetical protein